jgi:hypothetical protein
MILKDVKSITEKSLDDFYTHLEIHVSDCLELTATNIKCLEYGHLPQNMMRNFRQGVVSQAQVLCMSKSSKYRFRQTAVKQNSVTTCTYSNTSITIKKIYLREYEL